jgi:hypothetical protein
MFSCSMNVISKSGLWRSGEDDRAEGGGESGREDSILEVVSSIRAGIVRP